MQRKPYRVRWNGAVWLVLRQHPACTIILGGFRTAKGACDYIALRERPAHISLSAGIPR